MDFSKAKIGMLLIRFAAGGNLLIHGLARMGNGTVSDFDGYLTSLGFHPFTAWSITFFEIGASILLITGQWVVPLAILFCLELITGIILVHYPEGWFVVGAGRNGMEYSVLLILCFISSTLFHPKK
jgi:putative oxidoreductase